MSPSVFSTTHQKLFTAILLVILSGLVGCTQTGSNPPLTSSPPTVAIPKSHQKLVEASDALSTAVTLTATPTQAPNVAAETTISKTTSAPGSGPKAVSPSQTATVTPVTPDTAAPMAVAGPQVVPTQQPMVPPQQPAVSLPPLVVSPLWQELPAGSSAVFRLNAEETCARSYDFKAPQLPNGVTAEWLGDAVPCRQTLIVHTAGTLAPGSYTIGVSATQKDTGLSASAQISLNVTGCSEFARGDFTQAVQSNFITLYTAGKPAVEHGLLVPLQVCQNQALRVTLTSATSEANTPMAEPPLFYLYRSLVWPAPGTISAHNWGLNVRPQRTNSNGWALQADVTPGLYLLVFERDNYTTASDPDPAHFPSTVSYRLEATP